MAKPILASGCLSQGIPLVPGRYSSPACFDSIAARSPLVMTRLPLVLVVLGLVFTRFKARNWLQFAPFKLPIRGLV
jgi:hypothetical protein